jgi:tetraacyldisaccharide 4'-kinase
MHDLVEKHLKQKTWLSWLLSPLSICYAFIVLFRRFLYDNFPSLSYRSLIQIISVGNITIGGTGKTPFVIHLVSDLKKQDKKVAIILRGYKSKSEHKNILIQNELRDDIGDEANLYAQKFPEIPICVGSDRVKSIKILEQKFPNLDYIIMDDGFQYLKVIQDKKYLLFQSKNPIGNGFCLPAGILREPLSSIKYADHIIINGHKSFLDMSFIEQIVSYDKPINYGSYELTVIYDMNKYLINVSSLSGKNILLLSAIGSPKSFEFTIASAGIPFSEHIALPDHFDFPDTFIESHQMYFREFDYVLTTEKDATKLPFIENLLIISIAYKGNL